jgi:hypothetical protein
MCIFTEMICNACFLGRALENLINAWWAGRGRKMDAAMPQRPAGTPQRFFSRDSDIFQQVVVQFAQILPSLSAN